MSTVVSKSKITVEIAQSSINQIEKSLEDPSHHIHQMLSQKRDVVRYLAECYEVLIENHKIDIPTNEIAKYLMKRLESIHADITKVWIYESLPAKYKKHSFNQPNELTEFTKSSSLNTPDYQAENRIEIDYVESEIALLKQRMIKLKTSHYMNKLEPEMYREEYIIRNAAQKLMIDAMDDRKTVPVHRRIKKVWSTEKRRGYNNSK